MEFIFSEFVIRGNSETEIQWKYSSCRVDNNWIQSAFEILFYSIYKILCNIFVHQQTKNTFEHTMIHCEWYNTTQYFVKYHICILESRLHKYKIDFSEDELVVLWSSVQLSAIVQVWPLMVMADCRGMPDQL